MSSTAPDTSVAILHQVASVLNEEPDVVAAMNRVLPRLTAALGFHTAWMFLFQPDGRTVSQIAATGLPPALAERRRAALRRDTCFCQDSFRSGHLTRAVNMIECSRLREAVGDKGQLVFHASVPLRSKGTRLGILNVASPGRELFGPEVLAVLSAVGQQVAVAVERTRLYRDVETRAHALSGLQEAVAALQSAHTDDDVARVAVEAVTSRFGASRAALWLRDQTYTWHRAPRGARPAAITARPPVPGPVAPGSPWHPGTAHPAYLIPLQASGDVTGVLAVVLNTDAAATPILPILHAYATHVALALANSVLLTDTERLGALVERQRLARELHDAVSQELFSATLTLATAERLVAAGHPEGRPVLAQARSQLQRALSEMRALIYELSPPDDDSLESGLRRLADEAAGRIQLVFRAPEPPSFEARAALRRIAQEAVQNALRHAPTSAVAVGCTADQGTWTLTVRDDGPGFDPNSRSAGLGLRHMRERAAAIGAKLSIASAPGQGTEVRVAWPAPPARDEGKEATW